MKTSPIAIFSAGFVAGGIVLGGLVARANLVSVNLSIGGVPPGKDGSLLCTTASAVVRPVTGTSRPLTVNAAGGGTSTGVTLKCPT